MHERENALKEWLIHILQHQTFTLKPLAGDASFRRYFRLQYNQLSHIVMDAPPEKEDLLPFIRIAHQLSQAQLVVPQILAQNLEQGFLLLSDLGDNLLLDCLNQESADTLYPMAINTLLQIQSCSISDPLLPSFDKAFMLKEMSLCPEWFFHAYLKLELDKNETKVLQEGMEWIASEVARQPLTFIHRDYHSRNLMLQADSQLGIIDFQDAMRGPFTYDLVSLLKDCYISWPKSKILAWLRLYQTQSSLAKGYDLAELTQAFDLCGLQRHLKVLGVFCRLYIRDNKPGYLRDLPLTLSYVLECLESYSALHPMYDLFQSRVCLP